MSIVDIWTETAQCVKDIQHRRNSFFFFLLFFTNNLSVTKTVSQLKSKHFRYPNYYYFVISYNMNNLPLHTKVQVKLKLVLLGWKRKISASASG